MSAGPLGSHRLSLNQATVKHLDLAQSVDLCVRHQIPAIGLWRDRVAEAGLGRAAALVRAAGLHVSSLCRAASSPIRTGRPGQRPGGQPSCPSASTPNGERIASGEGYNKIKLLDSAGKEIKTLEGHEASVIAVGFTADSARLISFSSDGAMRVWDSNTGETSQGAFPRPRCY